jgi:hypothetical protein
MEIKMKEIIWFWNLLFYMLYKLDLNLHLLFNHINPFRLIYKIKIIAKFYQKRGISDMGALIDNNFSNKSYGISITRAGGVLAVPIILVEYGVFNFIQLLLNKPLIKYVFENVYYLIPFLIVLITPAGIILDFTVYKNDRYLKYFQKFEKENYDQSMKYRLLVVSVFIFSFLFFIFSFHIL